MKIPRNTKAKQAVLNEIVQSSYALSQPVLYERLNGICDRVTVYRILERLVSEHKIHKIVNFDGTINYAQCHSCESHILDSHNHLHFSCIKCKRIECIEEQNIQINLPKSYHIKDLFLTLSGLCPGCSIA